MSKNYCEFSTDFRCVPLWPSPLSPLAMDMVMVMPSLMPTSIRDMDMVMVMATVDTEDMDTDTDGDKITT